MRFAIGADHAGFPLKDTIVQALAEAGHETLDLGTYSTDPVDYPDFADKVAAALVTGQVDRAVLICGSGVGASVAANKIHGVRAALAHDVYSAHQGVEHDDMNVLCLGARVIGPATAIELVQAFAGARFTGEDRHQRRLSKINAMEQRGAPSDADLAAVEPKST
jgi:RpiB/LacA/LacB family sugar-phosphate isomerase